MGTENVPEIVWQRKTYLSARQTAANVTSSIFEGKEIDSEGFVKYANDVFEWLFQEQEKIKDKKPHPDIKPELPNPEQMKIIEHIALKLSINPITEALKETILDWAEEKKKSRMYPYHISSVVEFINWYKERK